MATLREQNILERNIKKAILEWAQRGRLRVVNRIRDVYLTTKALRRRSGTAVRSVVSKVSPDGRGFTFGTNLIYLIAWENGIRAHEVVARNAQALRFKIGGVSRGKKTIGGTVLYRKRVFIPAQAARPSFGPAFEDEEPYLQDMAQRLILQAIQQSLPDRKIIIS